MSSNDTLFFTTYLLLKDREFVHTHGRAITPQLFPRGPLQALAALALDQAQRYRRTTTPTVLDLALSNGFSPEQYGSSEEEVRRIYQDIDAFAVDEPSRPRAIEDCLTWVRQRSLGMGLDRSLTALERGDEQGALEAIRDAVRNGRSSEEPALRLSKDYGEAMLPLPDNAVPCGLRYIDRLWDGGVRPGELAVLLSSTNLGKTQTLCYFAGAAYRANLYVLYYTFELTVKEILRRITAGILKRASGTISIEEAGELLERVKTQRGITEADIEVRGGSRSVSEIGLDLEDLEQDRRKPDVLLLDSADDLLPRQSYQTLYMAQGEIYKDLRELALSQKIAVWSSTQATREAIDKAKISLRHMGDSYWKARRGHYVLGLAQSESDRNDPFGSIMSLHILKDSQHGTPGKWTQLRPTFGPGHEGRGYPGFEEINAEEAT